MKQFVILFCALSTASALMAQDSIWIVPALPQRGAHVSINVKSERPALAYAKTLSGGLYSVDDQYRLVAQDLTFVKSGDHWTASATVPDTAYAIAANLVRPDSDAFAASVAVGLDSSNGTPFQKSYLALAHIYAGQYPSTGIHSESSKVRAFNEAYWKTFSEPPSTFHDRISWHLLVKKDTANILNLLADLPLDSAAREQDFMMAAAIAKQLGNKPLSTLLTNIYHQKYPNGEWSRLTYYNRMLATKDTAEQEAIIREYQKAYPHEPKANGYLPFFDAMVQNKVLASGDLSGAVALIPKDAGARDRAGDYNNLAWSAAEKNFQIPLALSISKASLDTLQALEASGRDKPSGETRAQYRKTLASDYALYADTYAYLLYKTGAYKEAFAYEKKAMATGGPSPEVDIIARYHLIMEKVETPSKVVASLSAYIARGQSDTSMEAQFKRLYKGSQSADDAYAALEAQAKALKQAEMVRTIMNDPASKFTLVDLNGNKVSLDSLKGKTVVVDFWATWCGPCKASFPAMQKLVDLHKNDKNIAFLFVDTWETADDKKQNAADFIKKSPYTFHVLLDNDNKVVASYNVEGIPTKFVIDKNGVTRFKAVGFDGNTDNTVNEMESMISVAGNN